MTDNAPIAEPIPPKQGRVDCVIEDGIGWLWIDNQPRLNAMTLAMWHELGAGVTRLSAAPDVRVIVIAGRGDRAFCSGGDISEFGEHRSGPTAMETYDVAGKEALTLLARSPKPTIAMVQGHCIGGGVAIAIRCDLRIAGDTARLSIPAARLGLSYDYDSIRLLVGLVGPANAKHILYAARPFPAQEAAARGLVSECVPPGQLEEHVRALAAGIAANAPLSIAASKLIVDMVLADREHTDLQACRRAEQACLASEDYAEATRAFMEKRPPVFTGT